MDAAAQQQILKELRALSTEARIVVAKAIFQMTRVTEIYRLNGGGDRQHYTETLLAAGYMSDAEKRLSEGDYKKLLHYCIIGLTDAYKLKTNTGSLDDLMRMVRLYHIDRVQKYYRANKVMEIVNSEIKRVLDIAVEAGIIEVEK